ncbi:pyruvate ferredoxin oxidoreductase [Chloroflexota bacterium]
MAVGRRTDSDSLELLSGNYSAALGAKLCRAQVISAYPITPQTTVVERLAEYVAQGELDAKFIPAESEHSALSILVAASAGGVRTFTATSRHGIALMHEVMHWAGRGRCPIVMAVATASLGPPPDIGIEQDDAMVERDVSWIQFYCQSNQEILDTIIMAYRIGELVSLPVMVAYDGFITSHTYEPVLVPDIETVDSFLPPRQTRFKLDTEDPLRFFASPGAVGGAGYLSKLRRRAQDAMEVAQGVAKEVNEEFYEHFGRRWDAIECYRTDDAETILVAMTSVASIAHEVVDELRREGKKVGLLRVAMLRPFPIEDIAPVLQNALKVAVIDRNISHGHGGILALELRAAMYGERKRPPIFGFIGGLAGLSVTAKDIRQTIEYAESHEEPESGILWLGIPAWEE